MQELKNGTRNYEITQDMDCTENPPKRAQVQAYITYTPGAKATATSATVASYIPGTSGVVTPP